MRTMASELGGCPYVRSVTVAIPARGWLSASANIENVIHCLNLVSYLNLFVIEHAPCDLAAGVLLLPESGQQLNPEASDQQRKAQEQHTSQRYACQQ